jgi:hypothetical protein
MIRLGATSVRCSTDCAVPPHSSVIDLIVWPRARASQREHSGRTVSGVVNRERPVVVRVGEARWGNPNDKTEVELSKIQRHVHQSTQFQMPRQPRGFGRPGFCDEEPSLQRSHFAFVVSSQPTTICVSSWADYADPGACSSPFAQVHLNTPSKFWDTVIPAHIHPQPTAHSPQLTTYHSTPRTTS